MADMRDRLMNLIKEAKEKAFVTIGSMNKGFEAWYADYLIKNGVILPPCKVGDKVWFIGKRENDNRFSIFDGYCSCIDLRNGWKHIVIHWTDYQDEYRHIVVFEDFGKTVFLTKEEAQKVLEGRSGEND